MAESLCHLDLLIQLQAELFQEMLEPNVSVNSQINVLSQFTVFLLLTFLTLLQNPIPSLLQLINFILIYRVGPVMTSA